MFLMKKYLIVPCLMLSLSSLAADGKLGVGFMVGNPTGLNGKYWLDGNKAIDGAFAVSLGKHADVQAHSDYLMHEEGKFFLNDVHALDLYYGIGGRMEFADDIEIGVRAPVGLAHKLKDRPADVFGEVAPIVDFIGKTGVELSLAVGGRYYF